MRVAILGCGQLARMLALASWPLNVRFAFLIEPGENTDCVQGLGTIVERAPGIDAGQLYEALGRPDVITVEKEAVDTQLLQALSAYCAIHPNATAVYESQNRRREKMRLDALGIPSTPHAFASDAASLRAAADKLGFPLVVKAAEHGYDGKNQWRLADSAALEAFLQQQPQGDWVVEAFIRFQCEVSLLAARSATGEVRLYPAVLNHHVHGILRSSIAPAQGVEPAWISRMQDHLIRLLEHWQYVGMIAMECFVIDGGLVVNELAPRVHNSGHWTQQAAVTCQFENHVRAILGLPLGNTDTAITGAMLNLIGVEATPQQALSAHTTLHWYNKTVRPGRKVGHINIRHPEPEKVLAILQQLEQQFYPAS